MDALLSPASAGNDDGRWRALEDLDNFCLADGPRRVLVVGMGGGCDSFSAYAIASHLAAVAAASASASTTKNTTEVLFANCIGPRPLPSDFTQVTPECFRCGAERPPLDPESTGYGTVDLERSLPATYAGGQQSVGSPYFLVIAKAPEEKGEKGGQEEAAEEEARQLAVLEALTTTNCAAVTAAVEALDCDVVVGVDNGGDSLTGGVDFHEGQHPDTGRDRQVLLALQAWASRGAAPPEASPQRQRRAVHVILGPGCDGESTAAQLDAAVGGADEDGLVLGAFALDERVIGPMKHVSKNVTPDRTPNVVVAAFEAQAAPGSDPSAATVVPRNLRPEIPQRWLQAALCMRLDAPSSRL